MPRSFRSVLAHADELLVSRDSSELDVKIGPAVAGESERREGNRHPPGRVHQLLFERSQDERPDRAKASKRGPRSPEDD
jgi:hypothetical protein